jgi:hypothetical protein
MFSSQIPPVVEHAAASGPHLKDPRAAAFHLDETADHSASSTGYTDELSGLFPPRRIFSPEHKKTAGRPAVLS